MKLVDRVAVVTGAGRGIGRAISLAFAKEGADIVVASIDPEENEAVAGEVRALGTRALPYQVDVSDSGRVRAMSDAALEEFGKVDILVSNAGIQRRALLAFSDEEEWKRVIEVNVYGAISAVRLSSVGWSSATMGASSSLPPSPARWRTLLTAPMRCPSTASSVWRARWPPRSRCWEPRGNRERHLSRAY